MRVLYITYHFAPYNHIGAIKCVKNAKYLDRAGHDVHVITAASQSYPATLESPLPKDKVTYSKCLHFDEFIRRVQKNNKRTNFKNSMPSQSAFIPWLKKVLRHIHNLTKVILWQPDAVGLWQKQLFKDAMYVIEDFKPEVILVSAPPYTPLLVAKKIKEKTGIPWVAEMRDAWSDAHTYPYPKWRNKFDRKREISAVSTSSAILTVSSPLLEQFKEYFEGPTYVIENGYDDEDYDNIIPMTFEKNKFNIIYTGYMAPIYDPKIFLNAILICKSRNIPVRLHLFGRGMEKMMKLSHDMEINDCIVEMGNVAHDISMSAQMGADLNLLYSWPKKEDPGIYTGKFFEYLGSKRPIIGIGPKNNYALKFILNNQIGFVGTCPIKIADYIEDAWKIKNLTGIIPKLEASIGIEFTRRAQAEKLALVLKGIVYSHQIE